jgi:hypothetical protein
MHYLFFNDGCSYLRTNSNDGQNLCNHKPIEGHEITSALNHVSHGINIAHGISGIQKVLHRASAVYQASASINSERKRAVNKNSLTYVKGWGKLIAYAIINSITAECKRGWYLNSSVYENLLWRECI